MAGSMLAVGVAAPAFADSVGSGESGDMGGMTAMPPTSITGGVNELTAQQPLQQVGENAPVAPLLDEVGKAGQTAQQLKDAAPTDELLGQGTTAVRDSAKSAVLGAVPGASLLGGLPLGGLGGG
jgi:hypothetical protein